MSENDKFLDLLESNKDYARTHGDAKFDGIANAGVAIVTCMDSRIEPLAMTGLQIGDAKILRNPGGRATDATLVALVMSVALLNVDRIMLVQHTRCAMSSASDEEMHESISSVVGSDSTWLTLGMIQDQALALTEDVHRVRSHPLIPAEIAIGGFIYDVDTGLLEQLVQG